MIPAIALCGFVIAALAIDPIDRKPRYVRHETSGEDTRIRASINALGGLEAIRHGSSLIQLAITDDDMRDQCGDEENGWPVPCLSADEDELHDCHRARAYCGAVPKATSLQYHWFYQNCVRDVCSCIRVGNPDSTQDVCNTMGAATSLVAHHFKNTMELQEQGLQTSILSSKILDVSAPNAVWDSDLPVQLEGQERPCFAYGNSHIITFDRAYHPEYVTDKVSETNVPDLTSGTYWLVRDKNRVVSMQGQFCNYYDFDQESFSHSNCSGPAGQMRSLSISGRFLKGHFLQIDHRKGQIYWDGLAIPGNMPGKSIQWSFSWPSGCDGKGSKGSGAHKHQQGCLICMKEAASTEEVNHHVGDMLLDIALPLGVSLQVHRSDNFLNAMIRMKKLPDQDGLCGSFDEDAANDVEAQQSSSVLVMDEQENSFRFPEVVDATCSEVQDACLPLEGLVSWFRSEDVNATSWSSTYGGFKAQTSKGRAGRAHDGNYLTGLTDTSYFFGEILKETFTICTISRYNSNSAVGKQEMFEGTNDDGSQLFYHGQYEGRTMAAHYGCWVTPTSDFGDRLGLLPDAPVNMGANDWVAMCGSNDAPRVFGWVPDATATKLVLENRFTGSNCTHSGGGQGLYVNKDLGSDWAVAEVISWNRPLSSLEMNTTLVYLKKIMDSLPPYKAAASLFQKHRPHRR